jgi:uncharacterized protein YjiK
MFNFQVDSGDLEGITNIDANHLAYIAERTRKIVVARKNGSVIEEAVIEISGSDNKGPEALTYDEVAQQFHIMRESPGLLITLNRELKEVSRRELKFAQDYSSISFDSKRKHLWVLSDQSKSIHVLDEALQIQQSYSVNVEQMEGIAVDHEAQLYVFEFDPF